MTTPAGPSRSHTDRAVTARSMRALAGTIERTHPAIGTPGHLRDAARSLERGNTHGAIRHLQAAIGVMTPLNLYRHGVLDDEGHTAARQHISAVHRHLLRVHDIQDGEERLAGQRTQAAMNAPARTSAGPPDGSANGPSPIVSGGRGYRALSNTVDLVGPKGYVHGWHFIGVPGSQESYKSLMSHPQLSQLGEHDRHVISYHLNMARSYAAAGDHTMAEQELNSSVNRAINRNAHSLASAIGVVKNYHHEQATSFLPKTMTPAQQAGYAAAIRRVTSPVKPRLIRTQRPVPFQLSWADVLDAIELSARTAMLESTPAPYGRPGGPGLYHVKGLKHSDYLEQIVQALMRKRGMDKGKATAIARGAIRRWMRGGGHVHPEVRAAAGRAEAQEIAAQARAHAHTGTWQSIDLAIAGVIDLGGPGSGNPGQARVAKGQAGGGQFTKTGSGTSHAKAPSGKAGQKAQLLARARADRAQARQLQAVLAGLQNQQRAMAAGTRQATRAGTTGKTKLPPSKTSTASTAAAKTATSPAAATASAVASATSAAAQKSAQIIIGQKIAQVRNQIRTLLAQAAVLTAQAARL